MKVKISDGLHRPAPYPRQGEPLCKARVGRIPCDFLADHYGEHRFYRVIRWGRWTLRINYEARP
jgi:hypothetical protein